MNPLFGLEHEYGLVAGGEEPSIEDSIFAAAGLVEAIGRAVPALPADNGVGIFLANGARAYVDAAHLEIATPEVSDPWEAVRYTLAGDRMIEQAIDRRFGAGGEGQPRVFKGNVDYLGRETWGCHESFLLSRRLWEVSPRLIPHLVSRIVYTGAGGFDPFSAGVTFAVSPRALFMHQPESSSSMDCRGIVHTKDEPLSRGSARRRLHLICGERVCSERAMWLKSATTVIVLAMIDGGLEPSAGIALAKPVEAFHAFAKDPDCRTGARLAGGGVATALEMQRRILEVAETHADDPFMPDWTASACREWRAVLDELSRDPRSTARSLDWAIKRTLFERVLARHGADWALVARWTDALLAVWRTVIPDRPLTELPDSGTLLEPDVEVQVRAAGAEAVLREHGLAWSDLPRFLALRRALFECDLRFGELGARGVFADLDRAGVLAHRMADVGDVSAAVLQPPSTTRARVRGEAIRGLAANPRGYTCDWNRVVSTASNTWLDLNEPFAAEADWQSLLKPSDAALPLPATAEGPPLDWGPYNRREQARLCFLDGNLGEAEQLLQTLLAEAFELPSTHCHLARLYLKTGNLERVRQHVAQAWETRAEAPGYVLARTLWLLILVANLDSRDPQPWIERLKAHLGGFGHQCLWSMEPVLDELSEKLERPAVAMMVSLYRVVSGADELSVLDEYEWWTGAGQVHASA